MKKIDLRDAKARLARLVDKAAAGEDVVLGRNGKPLVRLSRLSDAKRPIKFGVLRGKLSGLPGVEASVPAFQEADADVLESIRRLSLDDLVASGAAEQLRDLVARNAPAGPKCRRATAVSRPPPPHGFSTWLDYAVATLDTRSVELGLQLLSDIDSGWSRQQMERAAQDELRELRRLAGQSGSEAPEL